MKRIFYILVVMSCCIFVSCGVEDESQFEEVVVTGEPLISWGVLQSQGPSWYPTYWYEWSVESALQQATIVKQQAAVVKQYEAESNRLKTQIDGLRIENKQLRDEDKEFRRLLKATDALLERNYQARANLLETKIERLEAENEQTEKAIAKLEVKIEQLEMEIEHRKTWPSFWTELKEQDPNNFEIVENTLAEFVSEYLYAACYITVADLKSQMREVIVDGEIENTQNLIWENHEVEESQNQKEKDQKEIKQGNKSQDHQEEKHDCEESVWHDGEKQKRLRTQKQMKN